MKPERQLIAIAEACGHQLLPSNKPNQLTWQMYGVTAESLPNYLRDLNAMHEAIKILTDEEYAEYSKQLVRMFGMTRPRYHDATAAQRAEAFLKTIGKWEVPA